MPTVNVQHVTSGASSGAGSLSAILSKVTDINDPAYENQAQIVINDTVGTVTLSGTLFSGAIPLTTLTITGEDPDAPPTISPDFLHVHDFRFIDHSATNGMSITLENLTIEYFGAVAGGGDTGDGGAIRTNSPTYLTNCTFSHNTAENNGGAIDATYSMSVDDCGFDHNTADNDGGAIHIVPGDTAAGITVTDSTFSMNTATSGSGGAIYFYTTTGLMGIYGDLTNFTGNAAGTYGGGVYQHGGSIEAISSSSAGFFSGFTVNTDGGYGSDLYLSELSNAHIDINVGGAYDPQIYLHSTIPPSTNSYWSDINTSRVSGIIDSNWPY